MLALPDEKYFANSFGTNQTFLNLIYNTPQRLCYEQV